MCTIDKKRKADEKQLEIIRIFCYYKNTGGRKQAALPAAGERQLKTVSLRRRTVFLRSHACEMSARADYGNNKDRTRMEERRTIHV